MRSFCFDSVYKAGKQTVTHGYYSNCLLQGEGSSIVYTALVRLPVI